MNKLIPLIVSRCIRSGFCREHVVSVILSVCQ